MDSNILQYRQRIRCILSLGGTLGIIYFVNQSIIILILLMILWGLSFWPFSRSEIVAFIIAAIFILFQNYLVLKGGGFTFKHQDILLMPYYEPFLWGFYYINIKRYFYINYKKVPFERKALFGLVLIGLCFSLFAKHSTLLLLSTMFSTIVLLVMFHHRYDIYYGLYALVLGFIIEIFGVSTSQWSYPDPDFMNIPYWFVPMWISVGILGRRFLFPLAEWVSLKLWVTKTD